MSTRFTLNFFYTITILFGFNLWPVQSGFAAPATVAVKTNTLIFKLKPDYESSLIYEHRQQLQEIINQIKPKKYKQKYPKAKTFPYLKPGEVDLTLIYEIEFEHAFTFAKIKQLLLASNLVAYVEQVNVPMLLDLPNDPLADSVNGVQYHLKQIKAYKGWNVQAGDSSIVIGILDTGVRFTHQDLQANIQYNYADPIDGQDNDQDGFTDNFRGWDLADNDNDPSADVNGHGVMVSGVAAAGTNNGKGAAGVGYKCRFLPIKVFSSTSTGSFAGYEGIVYAADHGCRVINLSWGSVGYHSAYEQDIINYAAINKDVVIVASAGNTAGNLNFYPASYNHVVSVAGTNNADLFQTTFSHSYQVDVMAPGVRVWGPANNHDSAYNYGNGTSFAAPIVAGVAALVRKQFPDYNARQVAEQLRVTADDVYSNPKNAPYLEKLGKGRINLYRALTEINQVAVRNTNNNVADGKPIYPGDSLIITGNFINILKPIADLNIQLSCSSPYVHIIQSDFKVGSLASSATVSNTGNPFVVYISPNVPVNEEIYFRYGFTSNNYSDYQYFKVTVNPDFVTIDINDLAVTITSKGNIGYNGFNYEQGEGVIFKKQAPLLSEGGLMIGTSPTQVSDNIRNEQSQSDNNYRSLQPVRLDAEPWLSNMSARGLMQDTFPASKTVGVKISYQAQAWKEAPDNSYVMLEYKITNTSGGLLSRLYAGLFNDWDIGALNRNAAVWDSSAAFGYVYELGRENAYAGVKLLTPVTPTHYAIDNAAGPAEAISLADGFTTTEKYQALSNFPDSNQAAGIKSNGNDVSQVVGGELPDLAPGESFTIAFALMAGDSKAGLQAVAQAAQARYRQLKTSPVPQVQNITICPGHQAALAPANGTKFKFYADAAGQELLETGVAFTTPRLFTTTTYYISSIDSIYQSAFVKVIVAVQKPQLDFSYSPDPVSPAAQGKVTFTAQMPDAVKWHWQFGDGGESLASNPSIQYRAPGVYTVKLTATNAQGCVDSLTKKIEIKYLDYTANWKPESFLLYANPATGNFVNLFVPENIDTQNKLTLEFINLVGAVTRIIKINQSGLSRLDLSGLTNGLYSLRISGRDGVVTKQFRLLRQ